MQVTATFLPVVPSNRQKRMNLNENDYEKRTNSNVGNRAADGGSHHDFVCGYQERAYSVWNLVNYRTARIERL